MPVVLFFSISIWHGFLEDALPFQTEALSALLSRCR